MKFLPRFSVDLLESGEMVEWGAKTIPEGGYLRDPRSAARAGAPARGDGAGFVERARAEGHPLRRSSPGRLAAEAALGAARAGASAVGARRARRPTTTPFARASSRSDLEAGPQHAARRSGAGFYVGGAAGGRDDASAGEVPAAGQRSDRARRRAAAHSRPDRAAAIPRPTASSPSTSSRPSSRPATRRATTSRTTCGSSRACRATCPDLDAHVPGAGLRGRRRGAGQVRGPRHAVELRPLRRDHRQGRAPDAARGRLGTGVLADVTRITERKTHPRARRLEGRQCRSSCLPQMS